jgi:hypothetical protein
VLHQKGTEPARYFSRCVGRYEQKLSADPHAVTPSALGKSFQKKFHRQWKCIQIREYKPYSRSAFDDLRAARADYVHRDAHSIYFIGGNFFISLSKRAMGQMRAPPRGIISPRWGLLMDWTSTTQNAVWGIGYILCSRMSSHFAI